MPRRPCNSIASHSDSWAGRGVTFEYGVDEPQRLLASRIWLWLERGRGVIIAPWASVPTINVANIMTHGSALLIIVMLVDCGPDGLISCAVTDGASCAVTNSYISPISEGQVGNLL